METANYESVINRLVDRIDFDGVYENILSFVQYDIENMLKSKDSAKSSSIIHDLKIDRDKLVSTDLSDYIYQDDKGPIVINNVHYSIEKFVFKLIHYYTHELVNQEIKHGFKNMEKNVKYINLSNSDQFAIRTMYKELFHKKLHSILKDQPIAKKYYSEYRVNMGALNYASKQEYIESCIHSSILINYLAFCKGVNLSTEIKAQ